MGKKNKPLTYGEIPRSVHKSWSTIGHIYETHRGVLNQVPSEVLVLLRSRDWYMYAIMTNPKWVERRVKSETINPVSASDCYYYAKRHGLDDLAKLIRDDAIKTIRQLPLELIHSIDSDITIPTTHMALIDTVLSPQYVHSGMTESKLWAELKKELICSECGAIKGE